MLDPLLRMRRAEADLSLHADIFHHIQLGLIIWRLDDDEAGVRLVAANPSASRMIGRSLDEMIGVRLRDIFPLVDVPAAVGLMRNVLRSGETRSDIQYQHGAGVAARRLSLRMFALPERCVGVTMEDVTERHALEARLRQTEKMETVGRLAGGLAHDFNNVLTTIMASASVLDETLAPGDPRRDAAREVMDAAERGAEMTRRLLLIGKRQTAEARPVNLNAIVGGLGNLLRRLAGPAVDVDVRLAETLPDVLADPTEIEQVVMNLVVNAGQAMPEGGQLTIETASCPGLAGAGRLHALLSVRDTGVGMDETTRANIFEPFFTTKSEGTGLGLATVYRIVSRAGGEIEVESALGAGTSFVVRLPARR